MTAPITPDTPAASAAPGRNAIMEAAAKAKEALLQGELTVETPEIPVPEEAPKPEAVAPDEGIENQEELEGEAKPEGEEPKVLKVSIPNNRPGLPDVEIEVEDQHVYDLLGQLKNGFMRGEEVRAEKAQLTEVREELDSFRMGLEADPIGFIEEHVPKESKILVAMSMITDPELFPQVVDLVRKFVQEPEKMETTRLRIQNRRMELANEMKQEAEIRRESRQNAAQLVEALPKLVPGTLTGDGANAFLQEARRDLAEYAQRHNLRTIPVTDLPMILAQRMLAHGIDPVQAAAKLAGKSPQPGTPQAGPQATVHSAKLARERKQAAAMGAPAGVATPASEPRRPPKGMNIKQAAEWAKANLT